MIYKLISQNPGQYSTFHSAGLKSELRLRILFYIDIDCLELIFVLVSPVSVSF